MNSYNPQPLDTTDVTVQGDVMALIEQLAENTHDVWARKRLGEGWVHGAKRDDTKKHHPCLVPYADLPESEKEYDRATALETIKAILKLGYQVQKPRKKR